MADGRWEDSNNDQKLIALHFQALDLCCEYNQTKPVALYRQSSVGAIWVLNKHWP